MTASAAAQNDTRATPLVPQSDEHVLSRRLIEALERENGALKVRLETEKAANTVLLELNETRKSEVQALRETLLAKNETIAAKEAVIATQSRFIAELKTKRISIWKRIGDIAIGAAIGTVLR